MLHPTFLDLPKTNQGESIIEVPAESHHQGLLKHLFHEIWHQVCKASCFRLTFYAISCSHAVTIPGSVARLYWKGNSPTRAGGQGKPSRTRLFKLLALAGMAGSNLATWILFLGLCRCLCFKCFRVCLHTFAALWNEFLRYFYNDVGSSSNWPPTSDTKSLYANWTSHCQRRPVHIHCDFSDRYRILPSKFLAQAWKGKEYIFIGGCHEVLALQITNIFLSGVLLQVSL